MSSSASPNRFRSDRRCLSLYTVAGRDENGSATGLHAAMRRVVHQRKQPFTTTYALGQVSKQVYAAGRTLSMDALRASFQSLQGEAQILRSRYAGEIEQKARGTDVKQLLTMVKQQ